MTFSWREWNGLFKESLLILRVKNILFTISFLPVVIRLILLFFLFCSDFLPINDKLFVVQLMSCQEIEANADAFFLVQGLLNQVFGSSENSMRPDPFSDVAAFILQSALKSQLNRRRAIKFSR